MPHWTPNGLSHDLPPGVVMHGVCQGQDLAIWRSMSGKIAAWKDRCQHRGMRLSHGFVRGETLSCIYHGWVYGTNGGCVRIPAHPALTPPAVIKAEAFDCAEADGVIWVAVTGTEAAVPDLAGMRPVRSLTVNCAKLAVPGLSGDAVLRGTIEVAGRAATLALAVQPLGERTVLHTLCGSGDDVVAVSRWLEALRRRLEAGVAA